MEYQFNELEKADLYIDAIYKGGATSDWSSEPLHKLLPKCGIARGFRYVNRSDRSGKTAYVVLYTSLEELEWPDYLDEETGIFRYYGDNRQPGKDILDTKAKGNALLENVFNSLNNKESLKEIPPFLIFKKTGNKRDVQFLGLAAPGNPSISPDKDLVAFWRTIGGKRFQNYESYFSILDTGKKPVSKKWLKSLIDNHDTSMELAPDCWKEFIHKGRNGIHSLKSKRIMKIPSKYEQLQSDEEGNKCLDIVRNYYHDNPYGFEVCAADILGKMDYHFSEFSLTRPWRDGGRDALGFYKISSDSKVNSALMIDCAMEAKCYSKNNSVGVKQMSRLISRIKYRQFGVMVTTGYVATQAYKEVVEDGHPILIITASDIAGILRNSSIDSNNAKDWLETLKDERRYSRLMAYHESLR